MKRSFLSFLLAALLLTGCAGPVTSSAPSPSASPEHTDEISCGPGVPATMVCRIVDGAGSEELLLAELETEGLIPSGSGGVFLLPTDDLEIFLDGEKAAPDALEDGMAVEVSWDGIVVNNSNELPERLNKVYSLAAWSLGNEHNPGGTFYDLCGFYLKVLDDLWQEDIALNTDISFVALDLSEAPGGLSEAEKTALAWKFAESHGVDLAPSDRETLIEEGYLTEVDMRYDGKTPLYEWKDGCFFSISTHETEETEVYSLPVLRFDAHKYRGPLAAYWFSDCTAVWPEFGTWSEYQVGAELIA